MKYISILLLKGSQDLIANCNQERPWMNTSLSPRERAQVLVEAMTFEEKVEMTHAHGFQNPYIGHTPAIDRLGIPEFHYQDGP